jgi:homoaconitase/3-isopropylmalate dehydratase large subunit
MKLLNNLKLTDIRGKIINAKDVKIKIIHKILKKKNHYQNVKINGNTVSPVYQLRI